MSFINSNNYTYDKNSNIYYNNENYNDPNKTIIGKLILNDGQPCNDPNEKLWGSFSSLEAIDTHLVCNSMLIFGKYIDDRFIKKENIAYKRLYQDNLNLMSKSIVMDKVGSETVSLYKREFLGIDKKCNENFVLSDNFNSLKKIQNADKTIEKVQGFFMAIPALAFLITQISNCSWTSKYFFFYYAFYIIMTLGF